MSAGARVCLCTPRDTRASHGHTSGSRGQCSSAYFCIALQSESCLQVFCLPGMGDFCEDNKSKLAHQARTPYKTTARTLGATCICLWDRDGLRQRYSFRVLTSSKEIKIFVQPLLQDFVILPLKLLLCKSFLKLLNLSKDCYQGNACLAFERCGVSPLDGIATFAVQEGESGFVHSGTGQLLLPGHVFALQLKAYLSFQHLLYTYSTICFINTVQ